VVEVVTVEVVEHTRQAVAVVQALLAQLVVVLAVVMAVLEQVMIIELALV
jgi:hypothetical protein